jgi:Holliday junction resolvase RusA-like endonuclease
MLDEIFFCVDGVPVPKQSFRYKNVNGKNLSFQTARVRGWENEVGWAAKRAMNGHAPIEKEKGVSVTIYFRLSAKRRVDIDNLSKCVLDGMKEIVFVDDDQVVHLELFKTIDKENPGIDVTVTEWSFEKRQSLP